VTFITKLIVFGVLAVAGVVAWQWHACAGDAREVTQLALHQFSNDSAVPEKLHEASLAANYWPLIWPGAVLVLGLVMFWDDLERCWKQEQAN
jgi:hypothetical protein